MITAKRRAARRGVLLLIVLSMLAIFSLAGIAYVVIASQEARMAKSFREIDRQTFSPGEDMRQAALVAIRGSRNPDCPLLPHSLLEDIYGNSTIHGHVLPPNNYYLPSDDPSDPYYLPFAATGPRISVYDPTVPQFRAGQQLLEFSVIFFPDMLARLFYLPVIAPDVLLANEIQQWQEPEQAEMRRRVGCVLTMLDGPAAGRSTRIVGFRQNRHPLSSPPHPINMYVMENRIQVAAFDGLSPVDVGDYALQNGGRFLINGTPFSGTGFGFNFNLTASDDAWLDLMNVSTLAADIPFALRPNAAAPSFISPSTSSFPLTGRSYGLDHLFGYDREPYAGNSGEPIWPPGSGINSGKPFDDDVAANEDFDAVDYQNMLLAMVLPVDPSRQTNSGGSVPIPSLHRPALINYWYNRMASPTGGPITWPAGTTPLDRWRAIHQPYGPDLIRGSGDEWVPPNSPNAQSFQAADQIVELKRKILLRPLPEDHPQFNGENPASRAPDLSGWDVDRLSTRYWERCGSWDPRAGLGAPPPWDPTLEWNDPANQQYTIFRNNLEAWETPNGIVDGYWDVDNDGDSIRDGIWVDLALPIRTTPDGRKCKPLVSYLIVDLDGRLNLNAQGCLAQLDPSYNVDGTPINNLFFAGSTPGNPPILARPSRGQGYGPAEINLEPLFRANPLLPHPAPQNLAAGGYYLYKKLLLGVNDNNFVPAQMLDGRYGEAYHSNLTHVLMGAPFNGPAPGRSFDDDLTSANKHYDYPADFSNFNFPTSYGTLPDMKGSMAVGVGVAGQPLYRVLGGTSFARADDPYEKDLSNTTARGHETPAPKDNLFTLSELDRLLREWDVDQAMLPDRLAKLTSLINPADPENYRSVLYDRRHEITTDSSDLPTPNVVKTRDLWDDETGTHARSRHITDLVDAALQAIGMPEQERFDLLPFLLSKEVVAGMRMDLNRPFGNGIDDDGNAVVDEPGERLTLAARTPARQEPFWFVTDPLGPPITGFPPANQRASVPFDHDNDGWAPVFNGNGRPTEHDESAPGDPGFDPYGSYRQEYAKHLYVLMMLQATEGNNVYPRWIDDTDPTLDDQKKREERARWIAQWAVNVVDFRDRDSIMTRFDYDPDIFDSSWSGAWNPTAVAWGCERPELLITETMAFHDRRTQDLTTPGGTVSGGDPDFDQRLQPEGSLFVELYNPWLSTGTSEPKPGEFYYDRAGGTFRDGVRLNATVVDPNNATVEYPVWRMLVVTEPDIETGNPPPPEDDARARDPSDPDPDKRLDDLSNNPRPDCIERAIYFAPLPMVPFDTAGVTKHFPSPGYVQAINSNPVRPGRYAVVGPGSPSDDGAVAETHVGFQGTFQQTSDRIFRLDPAAPASKFEVVNGNVTMPPGADGQNIVPVVINQPTRLSISEPRDGPNYYPAPTTDSDGDGLMEYASPFDEPLDRSNPDNPDRYATYLAHNQTHENFAAIHLQRLADPTRVWDANKNPYLTIDSMPVDLTTFNGVDTSVDPESTDDTANIKFYSRERGEAAYERWRNDHSSGAPINLWSQEPTSLIKYPAGRSFPRDLRLNAQIDATAPAPMNFSKELDQSFGYVNTQFCPGVYRGGIPGGPYRGIPGEFDTANPSDVTAWAFAPPFSWFTWNNRPFVSNLELLSVPGVSPRQLLAMYDVGSEKDIPAPAPYEPFPYADGVDPAGSLTNAMFPHLMNFFHDGPAPTGGGPLTYRDGAQMHRILDFVHVPSRFVGTETLTDPIRSANPGFGQLLGPHGFHPPFNRISRYRDPGRININTIFSRRVWLGLMNDFPGFSLAGTDDPAKPYSTRFFDERFMASRRGYDHPLQVDPNPSNFAQDFLLGDALTMHPDSPTRFANPFRSSSGQYLVPRDSSLGGKQSYPPSGQPPNFPIDPPANFEIDPGEVGTTLLRPDPLVRWTDASNSPATITLTRPLFSFDAGLTNLDPTRPDQRFLPVPIIPGPPPTNAPWADQYYAANNDRFNDHDRNPAFRFQALQRLGNLVTTRSNVYAIWVTVGYFEVHPREQQNVNDLPTDRNVYLEGYTLGPELGIDTGEVERHRAFYVFDRSIPVAFERGRDHNVEKAIVLKRFIE